MRTIIALALFALASCAHTEPAPAVEAPEYACVPAPTIAGNEWKVCELIEGVPCCAYAVGDCAVVLCRHGGCHGKWDIEDKECLPTKAGEQHGQRETCDGAECGP